jgi:acetyl/propionyl-CoA carboxylase alpha subunit
VRDDSGAYEGRTIPRFYDTLIAKLIVWGEDRPAAIRRMTRALAEYKVVGVRTTIPVLERIVEHADFHAGRLSTHFLERVMPELTAASGRHARVALIAAVLSEYERLGHTTLPAQTTTAPSAWRAAGRASWSRA